jgi:ADP-ribose pyrophosphatase
MAENVQTVFEGRVITVNLEQVILPNGQECELEIVHHPGGVAIIALDAQKRICMLRQHRHAAGGWLWEIPAGKREPGEEPAVTAARELIEEAGVCAGKLDYLGRVVPSPGVFTEIVHLYLATDLQPAEQSHEAHEVIEIHWLERAKIEAMVRAGEIYDGKTISALYYWSLSEGAAL